MTTSNTNVRGGPYNGDGVTVNWTIPFYFLLGTEIKVTRLNADGTTTILTNGSDYSVAGAGVGTGGSITLSAGSVAPVGSTLTITPSPAIVQNQSYPTTGTFPAKAAEGGFDRLTIVANFLQEQINRCLKLAVTTAVLSAVAPNIADPIGGAVLQYSADGKSIISGALAPSVLLDGSVLAPGIAFNSEPGLGLYRVGNHSVGFASNGGLAATFANPNNTVNYIQFQGSPTGGSVAGMPYIQTFGQDTGVGLGFNVQKATNAGGCYNGYIQNVLTQGTSGTYLFNIGQHPCLKVVDSYFNPDTSFHDYPQGYAVISSGGATTAATTDMIAAFISVESSIYGQMAPNGFVNNGLTLMLGAKGPSGSIHFLTNGVIAHVNVAGISNPSGNDKYNAPQSSLWFNGVAQGGTGAAVISTQGTTGNGTVFYDSSTGGYEFLSDNTLSRMLRLTRTALGVNGVQITSSVTGVQPIISPYGTDTDIGLLYMSKGSPTAGHTFYNGGAAQVQILGTGSNTSYMTLSGGISSAVISVQAGTGSNPKLVIYTVGTGGFEFWTSNVGHLVFNALDNYNVILGNSAQATTDTGGFLFVGSCAGAPTGVPSNIPSNRVAWMYDRTNNQIYIYNGGWKKTVVLT